MTTRYRPTIDGLVEALVAWLPTVLGELRQTAAAGEPRAPLAVAYNILPPRTPGEQQPPLVVVRPASGEDTEDGSTITVILSVQSFGTDTSGMVDDANTIQRIRNALTDHMTLGPFELQWPVRWVLYEEQPSPIWAGRITTIWSQPRIERLERTE